MTSTISEGAATSEPTGQPSLSARAYTAIRDMLIRAEITPGAPVNEDQLAKKLQMGRTPVREAIKRLETERLVVIYPRRGIFATQVALSDLELLTEVRVHLEGEVAYQAARRASRTERTQLEQLLAEARTRGHEMLEEIDFDTRVHRAIYQAAHNSYLENTLEQYFNLTIRIWHVWTDRLPEMASHVSELIPMLDCIVNREAEGARTIAIQHVSSFVRAVSQTP